MATIYGMDGSIIGGSGKEKMRRITKSQAGAIITSELDMAIEAWNMRAKEGIHESKWDRLHLFEIAFEKFEYSVDAKEKSGLFGYAKLSIVVTHEGKTYPIYDKGQNFKKENELDNTNGYYPEMAIDCMGFLLSAGLMYNLALANPQNDVKATKNSAVKANKPRAAAKSKS